MTNRTVRALTAALLIGGTFVPISAIISKDASIAVTFENPAVGKPFKEAQDLAKNHQWSEAVAKAREADAISGKSVAEAAAVHAFIAYGAMQVGDYELALNTYDGMISAGEIDRTQGLKIAMQLAVHAGNASRAQAYASQLGITTLPDYLKAVLEAKSIEAQQAAATILAANPATERAKYADLIKRSRDLLKDSGIGQ